MKNIKVMYAIAPTSRAVGILACDDQCAIADIVEMTIIDEYNPKSNAFFESFIHISRICS